MLEVLYVLSSTAGSAYLLISCTAAFLLRCGLSSSEVCDVLALQSRLWLGNGRLHHIFQLILQVGMSNEV